MQKFIKKTIGKEVHNFVVQGKTLFDVMQQAGKLSFDNVHKCGLCGSDNLDLRSHKAQDKFEYVTVNCRSCRGVLNFGQQMKNPDVFFLRKKEVNGERVLDWEPFQKKD